MKLINISGFSSILYYHFYDFMISCNFQEKNEDGRQFESKSVIFQVDVPHLSWGMIPSFQLHCCACSRRLLHVHGGVPQSDRSAELHEWTCCRGCKWGSTSTLSGSGCSSVVSLFFFELKTCYNMTRLSFLIDFSLLHDARGFWMFKRRIVEEFQTRNFGSLEIEIKSENSVLLKWISTQTSWCSQMDELAMPRPKICTTRRGTTKRTWSRRLCNGETG